MKLNLHAYAATLVHPAPPIPSHKALTSMYESLATPSPNQEQDRGQGPGQGQPGQGGGGGRAGEFGVREEPVPAVCSQPEFNAEEPQQRKVKLNFNTILNIDNGRCPSMLAFHPYEPLLVSADDKDGVSVCNFKEDVR